MTKKITPANYMITNNIMEVLKNKRERNKYVFTYINDDQNYYTVGKEKLSIAEFNKRFPIEVKKINKKGDSANKNMSWFL